MSPTFDLEITLYYHGFSPEGRSSLLKTILNASRVIESHRIPSDKAVVYHVYGADKCDALTIQQDIFANNVLVRVVVRSL